MTYQPHCLMAWSSQTAGFDDMGAYLDRQPLTPERLAAILNHSLRVAQEVAAKPHKSEQDLRRANTAAKAADEAVNRFNSQGVFDTLMAKVTA